MKKINLFEALKAKGATPDEDEKKMLDTISDEMNKANEQSIAGFITAEQLTEKLASLTMTAKAIKVGDGEAAKSIEEIVREHGVMLAELKTDGSTFIAKADLAGILDKAMPEIEKAFNARIPGQAFTLDVTKAAAVMTTTNTTNNTTFSVPVEIVESMSMAEFAAKRYGKQFIADIADVVTVGEMEQYTTWLEEGSEQGAFAIVAEGGLKPLVSYGLVRNFAQAQKIAGKYVVTEEFAKWRRNAYNIIRRLIQDKMIRDYSALLVTGINTAAAGYTSTTLDDQIVVPNDYDAIGAVSAQIESLNFVPNVLIMNPQDAWRLRLSKDSDNRYLFPVTTEDGTQRIFSLRLVTSTYQAAGYFTIGEAGLYKVEQEAIQMRMGYGIDATTSGGNVTAIVSDFDNNRFRIILEMFFKQWLPTPYIGSYVRAQFSTVKAALLKP